MDLKTTADFLKNKVQDLKVEKQNEQLLGSLFLIGENIVSQIKESVANLTVNAPVIPPITIPPIELPSQPDIHIPEIKIPEIKLPTINVPAPQVSVTVPEIKIPTIHVPEPKVTVHVEKQDAPIVNIPPFPDSMAVHGDVGLKNIDKRNPLPVQLMDAAGKPLQMGSSVSGGGRGDFFTIKDIQTQTGNSIIDQTTGGIKTTPTSTAATITDVYLALHSLVRAINRPIWLRPGTGALRVTQESSTGTVDTLTTLSQYSGFDLKLSLLNSTDRNLWYGGVRPRIT